MLGVSVPQPNLGFSGTDDRCDLYGPDHLIHWIHFNHSMGEPSEVIPVAAAVDDDGLVHIEGDDVSLLRWNHRPALLRDAPHGFGGVTVSNPRGHISAVPTESSFAGARTPLRIAPRLPTVASLSMHRHEVVRRRDDGVLDMMARPAAR
jgi:hypothetical protein